MVPHMGVSNPWDMARRQREEAAVAAKRAAALAVAAGGGGSSESGSGSSHHPSGHSNHNKHHDNNGPKSLFQPYDGAGSFMTRYSLAGNSMVRIPLSSPLKVIIDLIHKHCLTLDTRLSNPVLQDHRPNGQRMMRRKISNAWHRMSLRMDPTAATRRCRTKYLVSGKTTT